VLEIPKPIRWAATRCVTVQHSLAAVLSVFHMTFVDDASIEFDLVGIMFISPLWPWPPVAYLAKSLVQATCATSFVETLHIYIPVFFAYLHISLSHIQPSGTYYTI